MKKTNLANAEDRRENRDEVHYRTRATRTDGSRIPVLVVNVSPHGLMARCETPLSEGETLRVKLPDGGDVAADVRWALGGRIGCQFARPIAQAPYYELLSKLLARA